MLPSIVDARYVSQFRVWLCFGDGVEGQVDLSRDLDGPLFEPLRDPEKFSRCSFNRELRTLVWPNGADLAPEFLRARFKTVA